MSYSRLLLHPSLESGSPSSTASGRTSLFDAREDFIRRVGSIGMAAIYFGSFSLAAQDAGLSRQALFKLSFAHQHFLSPAGIRINVHRDVAILSGAVMLATLTKLAELLAQQIEGIVQVKDTTTSPAAETASSLVRGEEAAQLLLATDQTLHSMVRVSSRNGVLVLSGQVSSESQKNWAELLGAAAGVEIHSEMRVIPDNNTATTRPPDVDDESLQALILFRLRLVRETQHLPLRVRAGRGVVTLQGKVRTETLRQSVENIARSTLGLKELRSTLTVTA